ncbi:MAG: hypothetical protein NTU80_05230 [Verrucomicrobia bacterium]|nr:hypothetical protein [Verrucomicrobiota bacterium]
MASERIDAYRQQDGAEPRVTLARYVWNMALCEALYSPLQVAEVALRNAQHRALSERYQTEDWFSAAEPHLLDWQKTKIAEARQNVAAQGKSVTPGRIVAELSFGFWTGFFNHRHARTGLGYFLARHTFPHAPGEERDMIKQDTRWKRIRDLRNRVFHHERIVHYTDLEAQHADLVQVIGWISPELHELVQPLDRFPSVLQGGLHPWLAKLGHHWPHTTPPATPEPVKTESTIAIVPAPLNAMHGASTPFGHRWGGDVFPLSPEHLAALTAGQTLALDVQSEYVAFIKTTAESAKLEQAIKVNLKELGYGE